jgi:hypothetical protein
VDASLPCCRISEKMPEDMESTPIYLTAETKPFHFFSTSSSI